MKENHVLMRRMLVFLLHNKLNFGAMYLN